MKNINIHGGPYNIIDSMSGTVVGTCWKRDMIVTSGSIIKGNHKDANPWNYHVDIHVQPYGSSKWYANKFMFDADRPYRYMPDGAWDVVSIPPWDRTGLYNSALSRAFEKLRGDLDLTIATAEWKQTRDMLKALGSWEKYLLKGFWNPKRWANLWLEYTYGWKPLLSDCFGAVQEFQRKVEKEARIIKGKAKQPYGDFLAGTSFAGVANQKVVIDCRGRAACTVTLIYTPKQGFDIARWGSLNPLSIAWELTPYSFVVDWFYDIGGMLRDYETALLYSKYVKGYVSELYAVDCKLRQQRFVDNSLSDSRERYVFDVHGSRRYIDFYRTVLFSAPTPRLPGWKVPTSWQRWISAWALSSQILLGKQPNVPRGKPWR